MNKSYLHPVSQKVPLLIQEKKKIKGIITSVLSNTKNSKPQLLTDVMHFNCVQRATAVYSLSIFAFKACVVPSVISGGNPSCAECIRVIFIRVYALWHGPASSLGPAGYCSLMWAGGPGRVASRSSGRAHGCQVEGQVLWIGLLKCCPHHVLVVLLLGPYFSLVQD